MEYVSFYYVDTNGELKVTLFKDFKHKKHWI